MKNHQEDALPVLGSAASGLRFELVLASHATDQAFEESPEPFAVLSQVGRYSKIFLARVVMGKDSTVEQMAWKIQRSDYDGLTEGLKNPEVHERWEQECRNLSEFIHTEHKEIVGLFEFNSAPEVAKSEADRVFVSKPITFCKRIKRYFYPICPDCLGWLRDCTNEALLAGHGLARYEQSSARYLYCPKCSQRGAESTFYSSARIEGELPGPQARVLRGSQLYRAWRQIFAAREKSTPAAELEPRAEMVFPCYSCEHHTTCYPADAPADQAIPAEQLLYPVSYYEFRALPLQLLHIHYDDFCDLLGGQHWEDFKQVCSDRGTTSGQTQVLNHFELNFSSARQFIFEGDRSGLFPLEILRLKLIAFTQLCHGVRSLHGKCHQPHLELTPASAMAVIMPSGRDLPARWNFQIKLIDLAATTPFIPLPALQQFFTGIFTPPYDYDRLYTSPIIQSRPFGKGENMNVRLKNLQLEGEGKEAQRHVVVDLELISDGSVMKKINGRDLLQVVLNSPALGLENLELWCRKNADSSSGRLGVQGVIPNPAQQTLAALKRNLNGVIPRSRVTCYTSFFTPCDVFSLGMMLFRTLLVNDNVKLGQVVEAVQRLHIQHIALLEGQNSEINPESLAEALTRSMQQNDEIFSKDAVIYRHDDRRDRRNNIPDQLWYNILVFAFKLITSVPGFSICAHHGDYNPDNPGATMDKALEVLKALNTAVHDEIFGSQERNDEIWKVCEEMRDEFANL